MIIEEKSTTKKSNAGFILGIISLLAWLFPLAGYPVSIVGLVLSIKAIKNPENKTAIAGIVLSIIGLILTVVNSALGALMGIQNASTYLNSINH